MSALDLTPEPAAPSFARLVRVHGAMETRLLLRNGEQLLLAVVIPLLVLVGGAEARGVLDLGSGRRIDVLTPGVLALAVMSSAFTSLAIATGFERRYGVLKRLGATPLPRAGLLAGKVLSLVTVLAGQLALISAVALGLGWRPSVGAGEITTALLLIVLGTVAFASLGLLIAGTLRAEATLAVANLVYVLLLVSGAVIIPLASYPAGLHGLVSALPSGALAEGLRVAFAGGGLRLSSVVVLVAWAAIGTVLTMRTFRWE